jgi:hypothetical protein
MRRWIAALAIGCIMTACAGGGGDGGGGGGGGPRPACTPPAQPTVSFATNIQPIFDRSCAFPTCHIGPVPAGGQDLTAGAAYEQAVNVRSTQQPALRRVLPGRPDDSYMVRKIENGPNISGQEMPLGCPGQPIAGAQCLTPDDIAAIRTWITECAPNN